MPQRLVSNNPVNQTEIDMPASRFHERRLAAIMLVFLSGGAIFYLSLALQVFAWEFRSLLNAQGVDDLPALTTVFVDLFGYRPDSYLTFVVWWFWWPMLGSLGYCHNRYPEPHDFAPAFMFCFVYCWIILIFFISFILFICSMPFVILLNEIHEPPRMALIIVLISWCAPACTALVVVRTWWRYKLKTDKQLTATR